MLSDFALLFRQTLDVATLQLRHAHGEARYYQLLFSVARAAEPMTILELGAGPGVSSLAFVRVLRHVGRTTGRTCRLHSCDINPDTLAALKRFEPLVVPHLCRTDDLAVEWAKSSDPVDLLYIDADHSHEQSLKDFLNFAPFVAPNGLILMHDTYPRTVEEESLGASGTVFKTVQSIKAQHAADFECVTIPHLCGISILRKRGGRYF